MTAKLCSCEPGWRCQRHAELVRQHKPSPTEALVRQVYSIPHSPRCDACGRGVMAEGWCSFCGHATASEEQCWHSVCGRQFSTFYPWQEHVYGTTSPSFHAQPVCR